MRIGIITSSYPRWPGDVAGAFVQAHVRWLEAQGHVVDVVAMPRGTEAIGMPDAWEAIGDRRGAARALAYVRFLARAVRGQGAMAVHAWRAAPQWDAVCAHWLVPAVSVGVPAVMRARLHRWHLGRSKRSGPHVPLLAIAHGGDVHVLARTRTLRSVLALLAAVDTRLVWVSELAHARGLAACGDALQGNIAARSLICAMGIDRPRFADVAARRQPRRQNARFVPDSRGPSATRSDQPLRLLFVGRLVPIKGIDTLLTALQWVDIACDVAVVGDGPMRSSLEQQAAALRVQCPQHRVTFHGTLVGDELDVEFVHADAVVVPSRRAERSGRDEGMPVIALEAIAAGIPLIHSGSGGLATLDTLLNPTAHPSQVTFTDASSLAQAIKNTHFYVKDLAEQSSESLTTPPTTSTRVRKLGALALSTMDEQVSRVRDLLSWETVGEALWSHWHR